MMRSSVLVATALVAVVGCGPSPADIEELKKGNQELLAKVEELGKAVAQIKTAPTPAARPPVDPNKVYSVSPGSSPSKGPKDAKVAIVEFSDYQCPFCSQVEPLLDQVMAAYPKDVQRVYKQFPLTSIHPNAMPASKAALAAGKQNKFWEMHAKLFANARELTPDNFKKWAGELGLNVAQFEKDMASPDVQAQVDKDMSEARTAEVTGTPSIFVNGKRLQQRSFEGFTAAIAAALAPKGGPARRSAAESESRAAGACARARRCRRGRSARARAGSCDAVVWARASRVDDDALRDNARESQRLHESAKKFLQSARKRSKPGTLVGRTLLSYS